MSAEGGLRTQLTAVVVLVSGTLSILGCAFILASAFLFRRVRLPYWRLVVGLTFADLVTSITMVTGAFFPLTDSELTGMGCEVQGFFVEMFAEVANVYILSISIVLYLIVVVKRELGTRTELVLHFFPWCIGAAQGIIPLTRVDGISYTWAGGWCWVSDAPFYARFISSYVVVWTIIPLLVLIYLRVWWAIHQESKEIERMREFTLLDIAEGKQERRRTIVTIFLFAATFILLWIPGTINRIYEAFHSSSYPLALWQVAFTPLQGFVDSVVYGFTSGVFQELRDAILRRWRRRHYFSVKHIAAESVPVNLNSERTDASGTLASLSDFEDYSQERIQ